jgi:hypothetical protein
VREGLGREKSKRENKSVREGLGRWGGEGERCSRVEKKERARSEPDGGQGASPQDFEIISTEAYVAYVIC